MSSSAPASNRLLKSRSAKGAPAFGGFVPHSSQSQMDTSPGTCARVEAAGREGGGGGKEGEGRLLDAFRGKALGGRKRARVDSKFAMWRVLAEAEAAAGKVRQVGVAAAGRVQGAGRVRVRVGGVEVEARRELTSKVLRRELSW